MQLYDSLEALRDLVKQLYFLKASGISDNDAAVESSSKAIKHILRLKEDVRHSSLATEESRERTASRQSDLDELNLQLQNLLYEKQFYENEVRTCMHFPSQFTDTQIGLMPVEQFQQEYPAEAAMDDPHAFMLKRLFLELTDRKALLARRDELKEQRDALQKKLSGARSSVDNVLRLLQNLGTASGPLQQLLSPQLKLVNLSKSAEHLPLPLYVIYSQLAAAREVSSLHVSVDIVGSVADAQEYNAKFCDGADTRVPKAPVAKRSKKEPAQAPQLESDLLQAHPLAITLLAQGPSAAPVSVQITFHFLPHLRLITAACPQDPHLLSNLFPGDSGDLQLVEVLHQQVANGPQPSLPDGGRPYRWAQQLGGMDFISTLPLMGFLGEEERQQVLDGFPEYRGQQRLERLVGLLLQRKASLLALK